MPIRIATICRYPVKGLSAERLPRVTLARGECLPQDRRFAIALATTRIDPERPEWLPKTNFVMLMRDEKLALLQTRFSESSGVLTIERDGTTLLSARITEPDGRKRADAFLAEFLKDTHEQPPRLVEAPGHSFSDAKPKPNSMTYQYVSLVNLASVKALEEAAGAPVDPIRFRANLYFDGTPAWAELGWVGSEIAAGGARLHVVSPIVRRAATTVNPATAARDLNVPSLLVEHDMSRAGIGARCALSDRPSNRHLAGHLGVIDREAAIGQPDGDPSFFGMLDWILERMTSDDIKREFVAP